MHRTDCQGLHTDCEHCYTTKALSLFLSALQLAGSSSTWKIGKTSAWRIWSTYNNLPLIQQCLIVKNSHHNSLNQHRIAETITVLRQSRTRQVSDKRQVTHANVKALPNSKCSNIQLSASSASSFELSSATSHSLSLYSFAYAFLCCSFIHFYHACYHCMNLSGQQYRW